MLAIVFFTPKFMLSIFYMTLDASTNTLWYFVYRFSFDSLDDPPNVLLLLSSTLAAIDIDVSLFCPQDEEPSYAPTPGIPSSDPIVSLPFPCTLKPLIIATSESISSLQTPVTLFGLPLLLLPVITPTVPEAF